MTSYDPDARRLLFLDTVQRRRRAAVILLAVLFGTFATVAVLFFGLGYLIFSIHF
jgi:hypothetical protein